jgi:hypothetical protein
MQIYYVPEFLGCKELQSEDVNQNILCEWSFFCKNDNYMKYGRVWRPKK